MMMSDWKEKFRNLYPEKFVSEDKVFCNIHRGDRIFISTACSEPQYLVNALVSYVSKHPKAFFDAEVFHIWTLGVAPYTDEKFQTNFRVNSFFVGNNTREAVNTGLADYTPIFLSNVPRIIRKGLVKVDVALIQVSPPDDHGNMSLGISVDIIKAAVEEARLVIAQVNEYMPRVHGDTFLQVKDVDYIIHHDEPLLEFQPAVDDNIAMKIGKHVAKIVQDGDTIQVGYGSIPNAVLKNLMDKKHLGVHTELLGDGIVELIKAGVIDNSMKPINKGKSVATFCMGKRETYEFIDDNPQIEFRPIDYTNNPMTISQISNITAINSALQIDLTGQASAESIGSTFFSGIGGQADFMRGAIQAEKGKTILILRATARDDTISRIVPFLDSGAGVTLNRGDIHYVVTEYGIAYIQGKNIRERAMDLIAIAHPKFRPWLIKEAKAKGLIYKDQAFIPGKKGEYPEELEAFRTTEKGLPLVLRSVRISDEPLLKDFFYSLSDASIYRRFISVRKDIPHERLQEFVIIDHSRERVILATNGSSEKEVVYGVGQYGIDERSHSAEVAVVVLDEFQGQGIGTEILEYLTILAKRQGLLGFTAEVLMENKPMLRLFEKMGFHMQKRTSEGVYELNLAF
ncbi:MAG: GNAT family N-acetyltransferase [Candidatus Thermoplasmatota archaeon]|nr:GNAT family N-acetyltransferase [Candidatus Thermoplasmatota archaeon]